MERVGVRHRVRLPIDRGVQACPDPLRPIGTWNLEQARDLAERDRLARIGANLDSAVATHELVLRCTKDMRRRFAGLVADRRRSRNTDDPAIAVCRRRNRRYHRDRTGIAGNDFNRVDRKAKHVRAICASAVLSPCLPWPGPRC